MEVYAFDVQDVENKLYVIMSAFKALSFAVNGLRNCELIDEDELSGFEYVIRDASARTRDLIKGMQPVWLDGCEKIAVLMGVEE